MFTAEFQNPFRRLGPRSDLALSVAPKRSGCGFDNRAPVSNKDQHAGARKKTKEKLKIIRHWRPGDQMLRPQPVSYDAAELLFTLFVARSPYLPQKRRKARANAFVQQVFVGFVILTGDSRPLTVRSGYVFRK